MPKCEDCTNDGTHGQLGFQYRWCEDCVVRLILSTQPAQEFTNTYTKTECGIIHFVFKNSALFAAHTYIDYRR
jgi:hypothetical protein